MYVLMRDYVQCGIVEEICENHVEFTDGNEASEFSNKGLEMYAREIVERIEETANEMAG